MTPRDPRHALGVRGEEAACRVATRKGLAIRARNHRTRLGEIDLVLEDASGRLIFAEVKTRAATPTGGAALALEDGLLAVGGRRQVRLRNAALAYAAAIGRPDAAMRFDVFAVVDPGSGEPLRVEHVEDAF